MAVSEAERAEGATRRSQLARSSRGSAPLWGALVLIILYWGVEAGIDAHIFQEGTFSERVFQPDPNEVWMRLVISALIAAFGFTSYQRSRSHLRTEQRAEADWHAILREATDSIIGADEQGRIETFNPAATRAFGYQPEEVIGREVGMLAPASVQEEHPEYIRRYFRTGEAQVIGIGRDVRARRKDGSTFPCHLSIVEVQLRGERHFFGFATDLSERVALEARVREAEKLKAVGLLAAGISHDFNNLLTVMISGCEMILKGLPADGTLAGSAADVLDAALHGATLTRRILSFSRKPHPDLRIIEVNKRLEKMVEILRRVIGANIEIEFRSSEEPLRVQVDPGEFEQILLNLILNARDALPRGGTICVSTGLGEGAHAASPNDERFVRITVTDDGVGMEEAVRARIFEPFFTTRPPGRGTGLGLSTLLSVVESYGGRVQVESELGRGTRFDVLLPISTAAETVTAETASDTGSSLAGRTILVVDDDDAVRRATRRMLELRSFSVLEARNGHEALELWEQRPDEIDLLLTDILMPEMGGVELAERIAAERSPPAILFMSGAGDIDLESLPRLPHRAPLLSKPFRASGLLEAIAAALGDGSAEGGGLS